MWHRAPPRTGRVIVERWHIPQTPPRPRARPEVRPNWLIFSYSSLLVLTDRSVDYIPALAVVKVGPALSPANRFPHGLRGLGTNASKRRGLSTRMPCRIFSSIPASRNFGANTVTVLAYPGPPLRLS